jgi:hypothetical protein
MPVIINEFEVVAEPPVSAPAAAAPEPPPEAASAPPAQDVARILRHEAERELRVRAH